VLADTEMGPLSQRAGGPVQLRPVGLVPDPVDWLRVNGRFVNELINEHGAVVLRDFGFNSVSDFSKAAQTLCPTLLDYVNRSTPRTRLGGKIFTATDYPADKSIPLHNESSYATSWPRRILFYCALPAQEGGETPIADAIGVYARIDREIREKFERLGVLYVRNFTQGIDLSWQEAFQTDKRSEADQFCAEQGIEVSWRGGSPELTTRQRGVATIRHPVMDKPVWFNQAHLFHVSALGPQEQAALMSELGPDNVPRNALYGDGTAIEPDALSRIRAAYRAEQIEFPWLRGDIMILDNVRYAHARNPYRGARKMAVAMG
jgi:alpha-ketoglutarate-dependent taurine dioxygenase